VQHVEGLDLQQSPAYVPAMLAVLHAQQLLGSSVVEQQV
jgi:hypothetical protein